MNGSRWAACPHPPRVQFPRGELWEFRIVVRSPRAQDESVAASRTLMALSRWCLAVRAARSATRSNQAMLRGSTRSLDRPEENRASIAQVFAIQRAPRGDRWHRPPVEQTRRVHASHVVGRGGGIGRIDRNWSRSSAKYARILGMNDPNRSCSPPICRLDSGLDRQRLRAWTKAGIDEETELLGTRDSDRSRPHIVLMRGDILEYRQAASNEQLDATSEPRRAVSYQGSAG